MKTQIMNAAGQDSTSSHVTRRYKGYAVQITLQGSEQSPYHKSNGITDFVQVAHNDHSD